jgi:hypothetical protein
MCRHRKLKFVQWGIWPRFLKACAFLETADAESIFFLLHGMGQQILGSRRLPKKSRAEVYQSKTRFIRSLASFGAIVILQTEQISEDITYFGS